MRIDTDPTGRHSNVLYFENVNDALVVHDVLVTSVTVGAAPVASVQVTMTNPPQGIVHHDIPDEVRVAAYDGHVDLNAKIAFVGLRQFLGNLYGGVPRTEAAEAGQGTELAARVGLQATRVDWFDHERTLAVDNYFDLLAAEFRHEPHSIEDFERRLLRRLWGRSRADIVSRMRQISSILIDLHKPSLPRHPPSDSEDPQLAREVDNFLRNHLTFFDVAEQQIPRIAPNDLLEDRRSLDEVFVPPPPRRPQTRQRVRRAILGIDFVEREAQNRSLGEQGENFVVVQEQRRLKIAGRPDLAARVRRIQEERGDGAGYDVVSYLLDDSETLIEVKTTRYGIEFTFYLTANEVATSQEHAARYKLYRVFDFGRRPQVFELQGDLSECLELQPTQYSARR